MHQACAGSVRPAGKAVPAQQSLPLQACNAHMASPQEGACRSEVPSAYAEEPCSAGRMQGSRAARRCLPSHPPGPSPRRIAPSSSSPTSSPATCAASRATAWCCAPRMRSTQRWVGGVGVGGAVCVRVYLRVLCHTWPGLLQVAQPCSGTSAWLLKMGSPAGFLCSVPSLIGGRWSLWRRQRAPPSASGAGLARRLSRGSQPSPTRWAQRSPEVGMGWDQAAAQAAGSG